jgi:hemolysin activation/secretion protein
MHLPLFCIQAIALHVESNNCFSEETTLSPGELYAIGGHHSVRGYAEDQFRFRNVAFVQLEYRVYFAPAAAAYIFVDGGAGSKGVRPYGSYEELGGYGLGVCVPARIGSAALEWARNIDDRRNFGRIHIRVSNALGETAR